MRPAAPPSTTVEDAGVFAEGKPVGRTVWARTIGTDQQTAAVWAPPASLNLKLSVLHNISIEAENSIRIAAKVLTQIPSLIDYLEDCPHWGLFFYSFRVGRVG
jgi:hypothetical protein